MPLHARGKNVFPLPPPPHSLSVTHGALARSLDVIQLEERRNETAAITNFSLLLRHSERASFTLSLPLARTSLLPWFESIAREHRGILKITSHHDSFSAESNASIGNEHKKIIFMLIFAIIQAASPRIKQI